jgi:hypothetical protein
VVGWAGIINETDERVFVAVFKREKEEQVGVAEH